MGGLYLESRLEFLRANQNPDGGWSYFPGKASWLEPTAYAMLALHDTAGSGPILDRAWKLVRSWQHPDGSFQPGAEVKDGTWVTALALTLARVRGVDDAAVHSSIDWLLHVVGQEHNLWTRTGSFLHLIKARLDVSHEGWPWRDGNASWIEPTAHAIVALKKAGVYRAGEVKRRVRDGEDLVLSRRCTDGGWNYGTPNMLYFDLPSYPETTALALLALDGRNEREYPGAVEISTKFHVETKSSLGRAWLQIALRCHGQNLAAPADTAWKSSDVMLASLEALGHPDGNYRLFKAQERA